eukprot:Gb_39229 [translate_table: standard]
MGCGPCWPAWPADGTHPSLQTGHLAFIHTVQTQINTQKRWRPNDIAAAVYLMLAMDGTGLFSSRIEFQIPLRLFFHESFDRICLMQTVLQVFSVERGNHLHRPLRMEARSGGAGWDSPWQRIATGADCQILKWKVKGTIWLTYWANKRNTSYYETRHHDFSEVVEFPLVRLDS